MRVPLMIVIALLIPITAWSGRDAPLLEPGLSFSYTVELLSEGTKSVETLHLRVVEPADEDSWRLDLGLGDDAARYQALYSTAGNASPFAAERFESVEVWEDGWRPVDPEHMEILSSLREMENLLSGVSWDAESTIAVGARELRCHRYSFVDSSESVQTGESVTLRTRMLREGEAWVTSDLPFGGWVSYHEERRSRKISEFAGRRFEGGEEIAQETWTLAKLNDH